VIAAAKEALQVATRLRRDAKQRGFGNGGTSPLLMVSLNDGEDPHFRKAEFNPTECPATCSRPCEQICPAQAIVFNNTTDHFSGVISQKCYGCGRCLPICPYDKIYTKSYVSTPGAIAPLILSTGVDAIEIHTSVGRLAEFKRLWEAISPWVEHLKLVAISCPDGEGMIDYLRAIYDAITPLKSALIWQTDGRPMSGDIGDGTTLAAVKLGQKVLAAGLPGYVQLAGGTNSYTVTKLKAMGMVRRVRNEELGVRSKSTPHAPNPQRQSPQVGKPFRQFLLGETTPVAPLGETPRTHWLPKTGLPHHGAGSSVGTPSDPFIAGVAYGSYARVLLSPILDQLEAREVNQTNVKASIRLEDDDVLLWEAVKLAHSLVSQLKSQQ
jgi:Fe-S-cluster-containing hydrogenase component 2